MNFFIPAKVLTVFALMALLSCAAKPADGPGLCSLDCGSAVIASQDFTIKPLMEDINYRCIGDQENETGQVSLKWGVFKKAKTGEEEPKEILVPGVSVAPYIVGSVVNTTEEGGNKDYDGSLTPSENFCSDSCGTVSLRVHFKCPTADNSEVSVYLFSGGLKSEQVLITVESPEEETTEVDAEGGAETESTTSAATTTLID